MTLKYGTYRVGDKTYKITPYMSSDRRRQVEREYNQALNQARADVQERKSAADKARIEEARRVAAIKERQYERRVELGKVKDEMDESSITRVESPRVGGGVSSSFEVSAAINRLPYEERQVEKKKFKAALAEQQKIKKDLRDADVRAGDVYPEFTGERPSDILKRGKFRLGAEAKKSGAESKLIGSAFGLGTQRLLPPNVYEWEERVVDGETRKYAKKLVSPGGGAIRSYLGDKQVEFEGGMGGVLRPEAALKVGAKRLFRRKSDVDYELGMLPTQASDYKPKRFEEREQEIYTVDNVRTGETMEFKTADAAAGFAQRQSDAEYERELRKHGVSLGEIQKYGVGVSKRDDIFTKDTVIPKKSSFIPDVFYKIMPRKPVEEKEYYTKEIDFKYKTIGLNLPFIGRVEEPFITPLLKAGVYQGKDILEQRQSALDFASSPEERQIILQRSDKMLADVTKVRFDIIPESKEQKKQGVLQRLWNLDIIPGYDVKPSLGAQTVITGAVMGGTAVASGVAALGRLGVGFITGKKVEEATDSPLLGLGTTLGVTYGLGSVGKISTPKIPSYAKTKTSIKAAAVKTKSKVMDVGVKGYEKQFIKIREGYTLPASKKIFNDFASIPSKIRKDYQPYSQTKIAPKTYQYTVDKWKTPFTLKTQRMPRIYDAPKSIKSGLYGNKIIQHITSVDTGLKLGKNLKTKGAGTGYFTHIVKYQKIKGVVRPGINIEKYGLGKSKTSYFKGLKNFKSNKRGQLLLQVEKPSKLAQTVSRSSYKSFVSGSKIAGKTALTMGKLSFANKAAFVFPLLSQKQSQKAYYQPDNKETPFKAIELLPKNIRIQYLPQFQIQKSNVISKQIQPQKTQASPIKPINNIGYELYPVQQFYSKNTVKQYQSMDYPKPSYSKTKMFYPSKKWDLGSNVWSWGRKKGVRKKYQKSYIAKGKEALDFIFG